MSEAPITFEGSVETGRLRLFVARAGRGAPLLFLGGSNFDMQLRRPVFSSALPREFDVVGYEPRGLGRSAAPSGAWTMADYTEDARALMDALGWRRVTVMGESFGAMTAAELAIRHPDRIAALCLIAGAPGGAGGSSYPIETFLTLGPRERALAALRIQDTRFEALLAEDLASAEASIAERMVIETAFFRNLNNPTGYPRLLAARARHDVYNRLGAITAPTLVMSGRHDGQAPVAVGKALAEGIPGAVFRTFEGGHNFGFATPGPVQAFLNWWGGLSAGEGEQAPA